LFGFLFNGDRQKRQGFDVISDLFSYFIKFFLPLPLMKVFHFASGELNPKQRFMFLSASHVLMQVHRKADLVKVIELASYADVLLASYAIFPA